MNSKKSLTIKFLLILCLLAIALLGTTASVVNAGVREQYKQMVSEKYTETLTEIDNEIYNGKSVLDGYKIRIDAYVDDAGNTDAECEAQVQEYKNSCDVLLNVKAEGDALFDYVNGLVQGNYTEYDWEKIISIKDETAENFNMKTLADNGNLTVVFVKGKVTAAIDKIKAIKEKGGAEDLTQKRNQAKQEMLANLNEFKIKGIYSDSVLQQMQQAYDKRCEELDKVGNASQIDLVKGYFFTDLESFKTIVEEVCEDLINHEENPENPLPTIIRVEKAIDLYEDDLAYSPSDKDFAVNSDYKILLKYYGEYKIGQLKTRYKNVENQYSYKNYSKITAKLDNASSKVVSAKNKAEVVSALTEAEDYIENSDNVKKNVRVITTKNGQYNIEITSNKNYTFSPEAYVSASDYRFYAVKKNVNRILKKIDTGDKDKKLTVKFYININVIGEDGKKVTEYEEGTVFTVKIYNTNVTKKLKDDSLLKVVYYYSGKMEGYDSENNTLSDNFPSSIENQGDYLMFTTTHFSPFAICGTGSAMGALGFKDGPLYKNPFFYVAIILLAIVLILLITLIVKTWRYKITFKTNGGSKVKSIKAKKNEPFIMPSIPSKEGYIFGGWFKDKKCTDRFILYKLEKRKSVKVYAKWIPVSESEVLDNSSVAIDDLYKALRASLDDYKKIGFGIGLKKKEEIGRIIISNDKVNLYLTGDVEKIKEMGYDVSIANVDEVKETPVRMVVKTEEDLYKALELIDIVMTENGFAEKEGTPDELAEISDEERLNGYVFAVENDVEATSLRDFFEIMRTQAKSYVLMGDSGTPRDLNGKYIVKAKLDAEQIDLYLPYDNGNAEKVSEEVFKDVPAHYIVTDKESFISAMKVLDESMLSLGMKKYPRNASLMKQSGEESNAFGYRIRFN